MVYFRCTSSGSGKGNTVIVTCAEQFAGVAITIAKIGKSYTKVCPLSAPYVVKFYGVEAGTYTVSATVSGQTYSAEVVVQDVSCVLNYGFTWKTWVDTAQYLDSTDYASLSEVLADEEAVRELFTEHACVDYMADSGSSNADLETIIENDLCAKWINNRDYALDFLGANTVIKALMDEADKYGYGEWVITDDSTTPPTWGAKGNVPVMTSNTAPYGEAFGTSNNSYPAWYAFDGNENSNWLSSAASNQNVGYKFTNPVCAKRVYIHSAYHSAESPTYAYKNFKIQASNDNFASDVHDLYTGVNTDKAERITLELNNNNYYLYYRMLVVDNYGGNYVAIKTLQFYGRSLSVSVPTMTSNTAPFGECSASSENSSTYPAWHAFNENINDGHYAAQGSRIADYYLRYQFTTLTRAKVAFIRYLPNNYTFTCKLKGSNDGSTWYDCSDSFTLQGGTDRYNTIVQMTATDGYKKYEIVMESATAPDASWLEIADLRIYGLDYSEKEFEVGTTKKWLYDHGVELETLANPITQNAGYAEKKSDELLVGLTNNSSNSSVGLFVDSSIDFTSYNLLRCSLGDIVYTGDAYQGALGVKHTKSYTITPSDMTLISSLDLHPSGSPYNKVVDVSNINSTEYVVLCQAKGSGSSVERRFTVTELWLE